MKPVISIIIPCYNHGKYIQETLDSIERARGKYLLEVIIVNDGSTDIETITVLKNIEEKGYFVINQKNGGLGNARNNGIRIAKGKYILPLDSDNIVEKPYLNEAIEILETQLNVDIVYGNALYFGEKSGGWIVGHYDFESLKRRNYIDACAVYRKSIWENTGGYDEKMPKMGLEDWDFWINCSLHQYHFFYLDKFCFSYRVLKNSMIRQVKHYDLLNILFYLNLKYNNIISTRTIKLHMYQYLNNDIVYIQNIISLRTIIKITKNKILTKFKWKRSSNMTE